MISDSIHKLVKYKEVIAGANEIYEFLKNEELARLVAGEWHIINERLKVILLERDNYAAGIMECHEKFNDVHITLQGIDHIRIANRERLSLHQAYDDTLDYSLWKGREEISVKNVARNFVFLAPHEAHNNQFEEDSFTHKLVFKLPV